MNDQTAMRLDKWLWCARFFKTRGRAASAIKGGKVKVDGQRPKPAKTIAPGAELIVRRGPYEYHIEVNALSHQRLGASAAAELYTESAASRAAREQLAAQIKAEATSQPRPPRRPTKRERRQIIHFNQKNSLPD
ncbi:ribosome-associated heat shock protein Hsp15 [Methylohalomonas lacus]|uniref:Heat shock protein 15 n=1 Tax=Methylohalomonas lacus TaxID=398773 RepID=A0AAE3HLN2_9GAMM|nr:RNA-binding S4 domain-containing protein [Methylohalomonas lacus]MCS3902713.1 ribosome-associated heat shock protein Hsp15 [Methylohalomonas lacus]